MGTDQARVAGAAHEAAAALRRLQIEAAALDDTVRTAEALARARRRIDLHGLDPKVAALCDAAGRLPPEQGAALRPALAGLLRRLDALQAALAPGA